MLLESRESEYIIGAPRGKAGEVRDNNNHTGFYIGTVRINGIGTRL